MASILIIGEDDHLARTMSWVLLEARHEVSLSGPQPACIERAKDLQPDLVVVDNNTEAPFARTALALRDCAPRARLISLHHHRGAIEHWPAHGYLHKPFHADDFLELVEGVCAAPSHDDAVPAEHHGHGP